MAQIILPQGAAKTAKVPITVSPTGIPCEGELWLGVNQTTKAVTSGKIAFTSTGAAQTLSCPITLPTAGGIYHVYFDIFIGGVLTFGFIGTDDIVIVTGTIGPIIWI